MPLLPEQEGFAMADSVRRSLHKFTYAPIRPSSADEKSGAVALRIGGLDTVGLTADYLRSSISTGSIPGTATSNAPDRREAGRSTGRATSAKGPRLTPAGLGLAVPVRLASALVHGTALFWGDRSVGRFWSAAVGDGRGLDPAARARLRGAVFALMLALVLLAGGAVPAHAAPARHAASGVPCGISALHPCPVSITQQFGAPSIPLNGSTSLLLRISHTSNAGLPIAGIGFNDGLPPGLIVATPSGLSTSCDGSASAVSGSASVKLSDATLPVGAMCTVSLDVVGVLAGIQDNEVTVNSDAGMGDTSSVPVTVVAPPTLATEFGAASLSLGGSTSVTFTVRNTNATSSLTAVGFADALPGGLRVANRTD